MTDAASESSSAPKWARNDKTPDINEILSKLSPEELEKKFMKVKEGKAEAYFHKTKNDVFYNPIQEFNRDLSIAVLNTYSWLNKEKRLNILEALAASGIRSMRYAREVQNCGQIVANDFDSHACELIRLNTDLNGVGDRVRANCDDAIVLMNRLSKTNFKNLDKAEQIQFDCIDLDPYGSPAPFLDAALRTINDGGLLMVTATDAGVLCGNGADTCYTKYGSVSHRTPCCHEMALRILLQSLNSHAVRYSRYITPILSLSIDFYFRLFVIVNDGQMKAKESIKNIGNFYLCNGCHSFYKQHFGQSVPTSGNVKFVPNHFGTFGSTKCQMCGGNLHQVGPVWLGPLHDQTFVSCLLNHVDDKTIAEYRTKDRIVGMLNLVTEELDDPLYYVLDEISSTMHCESPSHSVFRSAILNAGYKVSYSHCNRNSVKTDAPTEVVWDILREWTLMKPIKEKWLVPEYKVFHILNYLNSKISGQEGDDAAAKSAKKYNFTIREDSKPNSKRNKLLRFHEPPPFWGPKARPKKRTSSVEGEDESAPNDKKAQKTEPKEAAKPISE